NLNQLYDGNPPKGADKAALVQGLKDQGYLPQNFNNNGSSASNGKILDAIRASQQATPALTEVPSGGNEKGSLLLTENLVNTPGQVAANNPENPQTLTDEGTPLEQVAPLSPTAACGDNVV